MLSNPQITGTGAAAFSLTSLPATIAADGFDQIEVTFNPAGPGVYKAQLSVATNDSFNPPRRSTPRNGRTSRQ